MYLRLKRDVQRARPSARDRATRRDAAFAPTWLRSSNREGRLACASGFAADSALPGARRGRRHAGIAIGLPQALSALPRRAPDTTARVDMSRSVPQALAVY